MFIHVKENRERPSYYFDSSIDPSITHLLSGKSGALTLFCCHIDRENNNKLSTLFNVSVDKMADVYNHFQLSEKGSFSGFVGSSYFQQIQNMYTWFNSKEDPILDYATSLIFSGELDNACNNIANHLSKHFDELFITSEGVH